MALLVVRITVQDAAMYIIHTHSMFDLDIFYNLHEDPDAYWVLYDLCLLNGWAFISPGIRIELCGTRSYVEDIGWSTIGYKSLSSNGFNHQSFANRITNSVLHGADHS
jgi:hypothetical protein